MAYLKINKATDSRASHIYTQFQKMTNSCRVRILCQMYVKPQRNILLHIIRCVCHAVFFLRQFHRTDKKGLTICVVRCVCASLGSPVYYYLDIVALHIPNVGIRIMNVYFTACCMLVYVHLEDDIANYA